MFTSTTNVPFVANRCFVKYLAMSKDIKLDRMLKGVRWSWALTIVTTFASVASVANNLVIWQFQITNAFLNGELSEESYKKKNSMVVPKRCVNWRKVCMHWRRQQRLEMIRLITFLLSMAWSGQLMNFACTSEWMCVTRRKWFDCCPDSESSWPIFAKN